MASIDKIYGTESEYDEFYAWASANRPDILKYFYSRDLGWKPEEQRPITNFPENVDMWLLENCPLEFVIARIKWQYDIER